jgi:formylmethanofuran dehydrogenase subunit B
LILFFKNVVCPVYGAACDDIQVEFREGAIEAKNVCKLGDAKFKAITNSRRIRQPLIKAGGKLTPTSWDEALEKTADILVSANRPLLSIGSETSCEAHEVGLMIGESRFNC